MKKLLLIFLVLPLAAPAQSQIVVKDNVGWMEATLADDVEWHRPSGKIRKKTTVPVPPPAPPVTGVHTPKTSTELQAAITKAVGGDEIHLTAGLTYSGNFILPGKPSLVTIRTADLSWSVAGRRIKPTDSPRMARIRSPNSSALFMLGANADNWRLIGLDMCASSTDHTYNVIQIGDLNNAQTLDELPNNVIVDRCYIRGDTVQGGRRGVLLMGSNITVRDSWIDTFFSTFADSQAVGIFGGKGPFLIENNYLEGAGENLFISAEAEFLSDRIPENIVVRRNHIKKRLTWKPPTSLVLKNLLEIKSGRHVLIEGNVLENNWQAGQSGYAVLFTARNWIPEISDIKFRLNKLINVANGFNILGRDGEVATNPGRVFDVLIEHNLIEGPTGRFIMMLNGVESLRVQRNTATEVVSSIWLTDGPMGGIIDFLSNVIGRGSYGIHHSGTGEGTRSIVAFWKQSTVNGNVIVGPDATSIYPPGNTFLPDATVAIPVGVGVDRTALNTAITGVVQ